MPIIIGIILGLVCLVSGVGFWSNLPNGDLGILFNIFHPQNQAIIRLAIDTEQISLLWLIIWVYILITFAIVILAIAIYTISAFGSDDTEGPPTYASFVIGVILLSISFANSLIFMSEGINHISTLVDDLVIRAIIGVIGIFIIFIITCCINAFVGGIIGVFVCGIGWGVSLWILDYLEKKHDSGYYNSYENKPAVVRDCISISVYGFSTILIMGTIWLSVRPSPLPPLVIPLTPTPLPTLTIREMTLVAMEQANYSLIAEITGTSTQLTANAHSTAIQLTLNAENAATQIAQNINETATEVTILSTEYALQQTQDALLALRQGTGVPTPPPISPTPYPTNTPTSTPRATVTPKPMSPTPSTTSGVNITLTANAQAIASLEMQSTNTPEINLTSQPIEELSANNAEGVNIADALRDPIWGGIAGIIAICGIPLALVGLYFAWKQSQK